MTPYENRLRKLFEAAQDIAQPSGDAKLPPLFLFTDPKRTPDPMHIAAHMPSGSGIIYRHFGATDRLTTAQALRHIASKRGLVLLIGEDVELAETVQADGVHLREASRNRAQAIRYDHPDWLLTMACHSREAAEQLKASDGLSAVFASPVFPSNSPSAANTPPLGVEGLRALNAVIPLPVYALGGITMHTISQLKDTGVAGIGAIDAFIA
jgi:thiamine-phosphate pyrophosphorylase